MAMDMSMADVHALSDQNLVDRLHFLEEVGSGNWGSVWMCKRKTGKAVVAVKLVHRRDKTKTSAARVRSLWNEMKTVRSFKGETHPSIVHFHAFIITPSYALIEMDYLPRLVPVEVREDKVKEWFRALASGVQFLHARGVVHNDIKPANILLTPTDAPVLVDFGFAQRYELGVYGAFVSTLSYGTPEYLSPERARGLAHDTRKSDVWALGVTIFEILEGRTPFEAQEGESFATKEDLERYYARTVKGRWIGTHTRLSKDIERLLRRMICPNADLRVTITTVMEDDYFSLAPISPPASPIFFVDPDMEIAANASALLDQPPPWELTHQSPPSFTAPTSTPAAHAPTKGAHALGHGRAPSQSQSQAHAKPQPQAQHTRIPSLSKLPIAAKHRRKDANDENKPPPLLPAATGSHIPAPAGGTTRRVSTGYRKAVPVAAASQLAQAIDDGAIAWSEQLLAEVAQSQPQSPLPKDKERERNNEPQSPGNGTLGNLRTSLRNSLANLAKTSTWGRINDSKQSLDRRDSWEEEVARQANTSLPVVHQAIRTERIAAENQLDRMSLWIQNVEKVVADARASFAAGPNGYEAPVVPSLPPPPVPPRSTGHHRTRSRQVPRAHEIFARPPPSPPPTEDEVEKKPPSPIKNRYMADIVERSREEDSPARRRVTMSPNGSFGAANGSMNKSARSRMESFENMRREMMKDLGSPPAPPSPRLLPDSSSPEPDDPAPERDPDGPIRPQPSMRLAAMMEAADRTRTNTPPSPEADAALARLLAEAPGAVRRVGAGLSNNPIPTKHHARKLSKGASKFFTHTHKGILHPAIDGKGLSSVDVRRPTNAGVGVCSPPPDTTFASEEFALVDRTTTEEKRFGSAGRKDPGGTIVRRAFRALNNAVGGTVNRRMSRAF